MRVNGTKKGRPVQGGLWTSFGSIQASGSDSPRDVRENRTGSQDGADMVNGSLPGLPGRVGSLDRRGNRVSPGPARGAAKLTCAATFRHKPRHRDAAPSGALFALADTFQGE